MTTRNTRLMKNTVRLGVESLEERTLLAANLSGGVLRIEGTPGNDQIRLVQNADRICVEGITIQSGGTNQADVSASAVQRIVIEGLGGDDHFWIGDGSQSPLSALEVIPGTGNDLLHSCGTMTPSGQADGVLKLMQSGSSVFTLRTDGRVSVNGTVIGSGAKQMLEGEGRIYTLSGDNQVSTYDPTIASPAWTFIGRARGGTSLAQTTDSQGKPAVVWIRAEDGAVLQHSRAQPWVFIGRARAGTSLAQTTDSQGKLAVVWIRSEDGAVLQHSPAQQWVFIGRARNGSSLAQTTDSHGQPAVVWIRPDDGAVLQHSQAQQWASLGKARPGTSLAQTTDSQGKPAVVWIRSDDGAVLQHSPAQQWVFIGRAKPGTSLAQIIDSQGQPAVVWIRADDGAVLQHSPAQQWAFLGKARGGTSLVQTTDSQGKPAVVWIRAEDGAVLQHSAAQQWVFIGRVRAGTSLAQATDSQGSLAVVWIRAEDGAVLQHSPAQQWVFIGRARPGTSLAQTTDSQGSSAVVWIRAEDGAVLQHSPAQQWVFIGGARNGSSLAQATDSQGGPAVVWIRAEDGAVLQHSPAQQWVFVGRARPASTLAQTIDSQGNAAVVWIRADDGAVLQHSPVQPWLFIGTARAGTTLAQAMDSQGNLAVVWIRSDDGGVLQHSPAQQWVFIGRARASTTLAQSSDSQGNPAVVWVRAEDGAVLQHSPAQQWEFIGRARVGTTLVQTTDSQGSPAVVWIRAEDGALLRHSPAQQWVLLAASGVKQIALLSNGRLAVLFADGRFSSTDAKGDWSPLVANPVHAFDVAGDGGIHFIQNNGDVCYSANGTFSDVTVLARGAKFSPDGTGWFVIGGELFYSMNGSGSDRVSVIAERVTDFKTFGMNGVYFLREYDLNDGVQDAHLRFVTTDHTPGTSSPVRSHVRAFDVTPSGELYCTEVDGDIWYQSADTTVSAVRLARGRFTPDGTIWFQIGGDLYYSRNGSGSDQVRISADVLSFKTFGTNTAYFLRSDGSLRRFVAGTSTGTGSPVRSSVRAFDVAADDRLYFTETDGDLWMQPADMSANAVRLARGTFSPSGAIWFAVGNDLYCSANGSGSDQVLLTGDLVDFKTVGENAVYFLRGDGKLRKFTAGVSTGSGSLVASDVGAFFLSANEDLTIVSRAFWAKHQELASQGYDLGLPAGEGTNLGGGWRGQLFQNGAIYTDGGQTFALSGKTWDKYREHGAEGGRLGLPTSNGIALGNGWWRQNFQNGSIETNGVQTRLNDHKMAAFLTAAPSASRTWTRRPTLVVVTHGANMHAMSGPGSGRGLSGWEWDLGNMFKEALEAQGSQTHLMVVDWHSLASNHAAAENIADHIRSFLDTRKNPDWDVVLIGHSRGALFNREVARYLGNEPPPRLSNLLEVMLDPTAATSVGDVVPTDTPDIVDRTIVYDDKQSFTYFDVTSGQTRDTFHVPTADYKVAPVLDYYDPSQSHRRVPHWYMNSQALRDDVQWLLDDKAFHASLPDEGIGNGNEFVYAGATSYEPLNIIDIGCENVDGDLHGYISVVGVGGVDLRIGENGIAANASVLLASGTVAAGPDGLVISGASWFAQGGVVVESDNVTVEAGVAGVVGVDISATDGGSITIAGNVYKW